MTDISIHSLVRAWRSRKGELFRADDPFQKEALELASRNNEAVLRRALVLRAAYERSIDPKLKEVERRK